MVMGENSVRAPFRHEMPIFLKTIECADQEQQM
jgi:hypothetical protein